LWGHTSGRQRGDDRSACLAHCTTDEYYIHLEKFLDFSVRQSKHIG
jgi:hypothetical protein